MEILVTGSVSFVTAEFLEAAFPGDHVVIAGEQKIDIKKQKNVTVYPVSGADGQILELIRSHNFEKVVIFSEYLELHGSPTGSLEKLRTILRACCQIPKDLNSAGLQIMYISSLDVMSDVETSKVVVLRACEELCSYYKTKRQLPVKLIRSPYLLQNQNSNSYVNRLFTEMETKHTVTFAETEKQMCEFLSVKDLGDFLYRFSDHWESRAEIVNLAPMEHISFGQLGEAFEKLKDGLQVIYTGKVAYFDRQVETDTARKEFGWYAKHGFLEELPELYREFLSRREKKTTFLKRCKSFLKAHESMICLAELAAGFFFVEWMNRIMGTSVHFEFVDVRLIFIVIMACTYGVNAGLVAAVLEGLSVVLAYQSTGMDWRVLFYEPTNWIVFIWYMVVGAACGYIRDKRATELEFARKDYRLLDEKYAYLNQVYEDNARHKNQYRRQIIGFRDSFGKIFRVTRRLDQTLPDQIYDEALAVLEELLENQSVAIYSVDRMEQYARLRVASHRQNLHMPKTIRLEDYPLAKETIYQGNVWFNSGMEEGYPAYITGVFHDGRLLLLVTVQDVEYDQMGMYYANLIQVLCGLIQISLYRAEEYNRVTRDQQYLPDSDVMRWKPFLEILNTRFSMQEKGTSTIEVLKLQIKEGEIAERLAWLEQQIRESDVLGADEAGDYYLMLSQVDDQSLNQVIRRLGRTGLVLKPLTQEQLRAAAGLQSTGNEVER